MVRDWDSAGSRWWKFDFHSHTPASDCYGKGPNQEQLKTISPRDWLLNYMKAGIDCVAITDHNTGGWIDKLKTALAELNNEKPSGYRLLYLFPGVEINANGGFHILAILPEDMTKKDVDTLLGAVKCNATPGHCDGCTEISASSVIDEIVSKHGIAIPAHADSEKGIFNNYDPHTLALILNNENVFSAELIDKNFTYPDLYTQKKLCWSTVLGSDSHHPDSSNSEADAKYPGSHFSWIKMSRPTIDGLRLALLDGNSLSIKRSDQESKNPNDFDHMIVEEIIVNDAKYIGRGEGREFRCRFNPWLNTIIGSRGTGKSTILEFIRLCLDRRDELPSSLVNDFKKYSDIPSGRHDEGLLTNDTKISVIIRKDGIRYKIKWDSQFGKRGIFEESSPEDHWTLADGEIQQRFPVLIFSQKQIFELSKDRLALLRIIDDSLKTESRICKDNQIRLENQYLSICAQIREKSVFTNKESSTKGDLVDINHKLQVFEEKGHAETLKEFALTQEQKNALIEWKESWSQSEEKLHQLYEDIIPWTLNEDLFKNEFELLRIQKKIINDFSTIQRKIKDILTETHNIIIVGRKSIDDSELVRRINIVQEKFNELKSLTKPESQKITDLSEYDEILIRKQVLTKELESIYSIKQEITKLEFERDEILERNYKNRDSLSKIRKTFLENSLQSNISISIDLIQFGDKENIETEFRTLIERNDEKFENDITYLLTILQEDSIEGISFFKKIIRELYYGNSNIVEDHRFDQRFKNHISSLDPEKLDRIFCYFPEDTLDVKYFDSKQRKFVQIDHGSPGQKNATLLSFIMMQGDEPLILDQPEDDLDNQLIYNNIVGQLKENKTRRQVIVVTHNANVVVNGDSENVIPLNISSGQTVISSQGGLQEQEIRNQVCDILEGGKEAFKSRYKRINV